MNELDGLIAEAEIGERAKEFLESELGRTLTGMARQEVKRAQEALLKVSATDTEAIKNLQNDAWRGIMFQRWLGELVDKGETAVKIFTQQRNEA